MTSQTMEQLLDSCQKFVLCGRCMLDAIEEMAQTLQKTCAADQVTAEREEDEQDRGQKAETKEQAPRERTASLEEVRALLAAKARKGFRAEVKALLTAHGAKQLSDIQDPAELGRLMEEAINIGGSDA